MARRSPPRKVTYFEPVAPRLARNTVIESTFEVGRRFRCTMRVDCGRLDPGAVIRPHPGEWSPRMPERLDDPPKRKPRWGDRGFQDQRSRRGDMRSIAGYLANSAGAQPSTRRCAISRNYRITRWVRMPGRSGSSPAWEIWGPETAFGTFPGSRAVAAARRRGVRGRTADHVPCPRYPPARRTVFSRSGQAARSWPRRRPALAPHDRRQDGGT
jgi:hypothetical protein